MSGSSAPGAVVRQGRRATSIFWLTSVLADLEEILRIAAKDGAGNVRVFGSVARGEDDEMSDIDLLVEVEAGRSLLDQAGLWLDLQELLGCKVDVVSESGIKPRIKERVLWEAVPL